MKSRRSHRRRKLPKSLKVVIAVNALAVAVEAVSAVVFLDQLAVTDFGGTILSIILMILVTFGILQRSRFVRMLVLIIAWLAAVLLACALIGGLMMIGMPALIAMVPLVVCGITIWGLTTSKAKRYFRLRS